MQRPSKRCKHKAASIKKWMRVFASTETVEKLSPDSKRSEVARGKRLGKGG